MFSLPYCRGQPHDDVEDDAGGVSTADPRQLPFDRSQLVLQVFVPCDRRVDMLPFEHSMLSSEDLTTAHLMFGDEARSYLADTSASSMRLVVSRVRVRFRSGSEGGGGQGRGGSFAPCGVWVASPTFWGLVRRVRCKCRPDASIHTTFTFDQSHELGCPCTELVSVKYPRQFFDSNTHD